MKYAIIKYKISCVLLLLAVYTSLASSTKKGAIAGNAGIGFVENKGQIVDVDGNQHPEMLFFGSFSNGNVLFKKTGLTYLLVKKEETHLTGTNGIMQEEPADNEPSVSVCRVDVDFVGVSDNVIVNPIKKQNFHLNYYNAQYAFNELNSYEQLLAKNIYPGIDVLYKQQQQGFKYDVLVNPGANPENIVLKYSGAQNVTLESSREGKRLKVETALGTIGEWMPKVYQVKNGKIIDVDAAYQLIKEEENTYVKINVGEYDKTLQLVIDPWVTYFGSLLDDEPGHITVDAAGNLIVTGETNTSIGGMMLLPTTLGVAQRLGAGKKDAFVAKFSPAGNLIWATCFGGSGDDIGIGVEVDKTTNEVYFSGTTASTDFPVTAGAHKTAISVGTVAALTVDGFIAKLNNAGQRVWATYYGGSRVEMELRVAVDPSGNVYAAGATSSADLTVPGAFQGSLRGLSDAFLSKWDAAGNLIWATYCGSSSRDEITKGGSVATDLAGNVYMVGATQGGDFPFTAGSPYQPVYGSAGIPGSSDGFIIKFTTAGNPLWASYLGGSHQDMANDVATDGNMNVVVTGRTYSDNFKTTTGSYQPVFASGTSGTEDIFIVKFDATGNCLWSTYMGGTGRDYGCGVAIDNTNHIIISGVTLGITPMHHDTSNFPVTSCAYQTTFGGVEDNIFARFTPDGQLVCSSYIGGDNGVSGPHSSFTYDITAYGGVAVYDSWIYLAGFTKDNNYPTTAGAYQPARKGGADVVLMQMCALTCGYNELELDFTASNKCANQPISFTSAVAACDVSNTIYSWDFTGGTASSLTSANPTVTYPAPGTYTVKLKVSSPCSEDSIAKTIVIDPPVIATHTVTPVVCYGESNGAIHTTVSGGVGAYTYSWAPSSQTGNIATNLAAGTHIYTVTDEVGCVYTTTVAMTEPPLLALTASPLQQACAGETITMATVVSGGNGGYIYNWSLTGPTVTLTATETFTVTVTDSKGCTTLPVEITVNINELPYVFFDADFTEGCAPLCVNFKDSVSGNIYNWNFGDGDTSSVANPNHCYSQPGAYTVSLTVTNASGCSAQTVKENYINVYPVPVAAFTSTPDEVQLLTSPVVQFTDQSVGASQWYWVLNEHTEESSTMQHPSYTYSETGIFNVVLFATNEYGCSDTAYGIVEVKPDKAIYIPNTFTPNNDGVNDIFIPVMVGVKTTTYTFSVFDRWGNMFFKSNSPHIGWNGKLPLSGDDALQDVYVWTLTLIDEENNKKEYLGQVNLLR